MCWRGASAPCTTLALIYVRLSTWFEKRPAHRCGRPPVSLTAATAARITSVTTCGCEIMITWEPSTSVIFAPARLAIERMTSLPAALSPVATTAQEGKFFQAGTPDGSRSEEHTSELQSQSNLVCRLLLEKKKNMPIETHDNSHHYLNS